MFKAQIFKIKIPLRFSNLRFRIFAESGQTLVEAIVALSALMISLAGIAIAVIYAVNNTTFVKNQNLANKYAQQGMEYLKNKAANGELVTLNPPILGKSQEDFRNLDGSYCFDENYDISSLAGSCTTNVEGYFKRSVSFNNSNCGNKVFSGTEVMITVSWPSSKCPSDNTYCHKAELNSCFAQGSNSSL